MSPDPARGGQEYIVGGARLTTSIRLPDLPTQGFHDHTVEITFGDATSPTPQGWHPLPRRASWEATVHLHPSGRQAFIQVGDSRSGLSQDARWLTPFASALQGKATLHAAGIQLSQAAAALIAGSGTGKSTLAAAAAALGASILADDLLPVRMRENQVWAPDGALSALCFLERPTGGKELHIRPLTPSATLRSLLKNSFGELAAERVWRTQFEFFELLVNGVRGYQLTIPDDPAVVPEVAATLCEFLRSSHADPIGDQR